MTELQRGGNAPVSGTNLTVRIDGTPPTGVDFDVSAYLLGETGKARGDEDMVFYNQPSGADGAVRFSKDGGAMGMFEVDLGRLPSTIRRIVFCVTIEGAAARRHTLAQLSNARISAGDTVFTPALATATEAAMIFGELYLRNGGWKFRAVGQGFNGGLAPLARSFGIDIAEEAGTPSPALAATGRISLEKKIAATAPRLVSLAKAAIISIEKHRLGDTRAQVALVLDRSGSMQGQYQRGRVQDLLDRVLPLAAHFDDDGALDVWAFGASCQALTPVTLHTIDDYVSREGGGWKSWKVGWTNDEPKVLSAVIEKFRRADPPAYIIFVSDGGVSATTKITSLLKEASCYPIFWQFVGLGGSRYGVLEKLDTMAGRTVDNCNFFALDDLHDVTDAELYDRLLAEFPLWIGAAGRAGVLQ